MKTKIILIGGGVVLAAGIAYYLYNKKRLTQLPEGSGGSSPLLPSSSDVAPSQSPTATTPQAAQAVRQTMWKDRDGNIFELTGTKQRWGYVIKVNGSIQAKNNQAEVMVLGPDGYMISADNNGSTFVYKNGGWQNVVRDNKTATAQYLAKVGVTYPTGAFAGLGRLGSYILT